MGRIELSGSCLCRAVTYELSGAAGHFYHCHCERCRKATGTGHASNMILTDSRVRWTAGEALITRYKLPGAKRFSTTFCSVCGGLLPRHDAESGIAVVPAGSLDGEPGMLPEARIFGGSRAPWSCDGSELPVHETYPGT